MNIQQAIKAIKNLQSKLYILSECDELKIIVHKPTEFRGFSSYQIESMNFSGEKTVYALNGQIERVAHYNSNLIAASENLENLVQGLDEFDDVNLSLMNSKFRPLKF